MDSPRPNADVVIENGRVKEIRDASGQCDRQAACITPGMVNAHVHLEMSGEPDTMAIFFALTPMQRMLRAVANARKSLRAGVTTVRDLGGSEQIPIEIRDAVDQGRLEGPRIRAAGYVLCMTGGHGWPVGRAVDSPDDGRKAVREQRLAGADCIKLIATGGVLTKGAVPGTSQADARGDERDLHRSAPARFTRSRTCNRNARHQRRIARRRRFDRARDAAGR